MHQADLDFDLSLKEISKVEGSASLHLSVKAGIITDLKFSITEWKRFYTQGVEGKPVAGVPQLVDRICGTCSNAHLLASIKALENGLHITPSAQTMLLRKLLYYGLIIRDHALHLYIFGIPDLLGKSSILDLNEKIDFEHQLLHDAFNVKEVGNKLSIITGGRSVHAPYPTIGGFLKLPELGQLKNLIPALERIRPAVIRLIELYANKDTMLKLKTPLTYAGLVSDDFSFLEGTIQTSDNTIIEESSFGNHLAEVIIPYSHARGFTFKGKLMITGALARLNLDKEHLHPKTKVDTLKYFSLFPSQNLFHNNLAQAVEILHSIDSAVGIIEKLNEIVPESPPKI
jgi:coenzyme F420-reducing hydrogenase alpha subunit